MDLPIKARMKFEALIDAAQTGQDAVLSATRRLSDLGAAATTAPAEERANVEHEETRWRVKLDQAQRAHRAAADLASRLSDWLTQVRHLSLEDAKGNIPKLAKGQTVGEAANLVRAKIRSLTDERRDVERCALPLDDLKEQAAAFVANLRMCSKPRITFGHGQPFNVVFEANIENTWTPQKDLAAVAAYLDATSFLRRLIEDIEAQPRPSLAMSAKARAERLTTIAADHLLLEFEDEALVVFSEVDGPILQRRSDADPRAILGLIVGRRISPAPQSVKKERVKSSFEEGKPKRMSEAELIEAFGKKEGSASNR